MTEPSNVFIRNNTEVSIYFPDFFPDGIPAGKMIQLEGYPFATVNPAFSVEKAAERESWCILNAKEFFLKQTTSAPGIKLSGIFVHSFAAMFASGGKPGRFFLNFSRIS